MLNAAGTIGSGENMVNMGISFALDKKNNVSNTRVVMAQEIVELRAHVVQQEAQIQKLMLMVAKMSGNYSEVTETLAPKAAEIFPDVPENHWAYEYAAGLQRQGILEGYEDGYFKGDKTMTRYEFVAMLFRAMENGAILDDKISEEFKDELGRIRVDRIKGLDADPSKIERVRVVSDGNRDDYGYQIN